MRPMGTVGIVVRGEARAEEALRAALGLTLAGGHVIAVVIDEAARTACQGAPVGTQLRRHIDTLLALGHEVAYGPPGLARLAEVAALVEVWA